MNSMVAEPRASPRPPACSEAVEAALSSRDDSSRDDSSRDDSKARDDYYFLSNIDEYHDRLLLARDRIDAELARETEELPSALVLPCHAAGDLEAWATSAASWRADFGADAGQRLRDVSLENARRLLLQCAPAALTEGCALQYVSSAATSHLATVAHLVKSYIRVSGGGDPMRHAGAAYADLLRGLGLSLPDAGSWALARHPDIADRMFAMPMFQLAISQFPQSFMPELLGLNLFNAVRGIHPVVEALEPRIRLVADTRRYFATIGSAAHAGLACQDAIAAIGAYFADAAHAAAWTRLRRGFAAGFALHYAEVLALFAMAEGPAFSARGRMVELVQRKGPFAFGYHAKRKLGGRSLDGWFDPQTFDPAALVDQLARSPYVRPGSPEQSALIAISVAPRGVMAGIFSKDEVATLAAWIEGLAPGSDAALPAFDHPPIAEPAAYRPASHAPRPSSPAPEASRNYARMPPRELYWYLLQIEQFPDLLDYAKKFANLWLSRSGLGLEKGSRPIPFARYDHAALDAWLIAQHTSQVASYTGPPPEIPSRDAVIAASVQLCPLVFIDGAWLQKTSNIAFCGSAVGSRLFGIYLDEIGNGDARENHPNVYRELMRQMGVDLPPFGSMEFSTWPGFDDAAFLVPTFWLCISQFPKHFLPEILGLNLAMELSGVGGSYRTGGDMLRHYGYDPAFIDLHNTVDNVSTGHTAVALDAIKTHMDEIFERGGGDEVQRRWKRVWTGYRALVPPNGFA